MKNILKPLACLPLCFVLTRAAFTVRDAVYSAVRIPPPGVPGFTSAVLFRCGSDLLAFQCALTLILCILWLCVRFSLLLDGGHEGPDGGDAVP